MYIIVSKASKAPYKHPKLVMLERIRHKISVKELTTTSCCLLVKTLLVQTVGKFGIIILALMNQILFLLPSIRTITGLLQSLVLIHILDDFQKTANRIHKVLYEVTKLKPWENSDLLSRLVVNSLTVTRGMQQEHIQ